MVDWFLSMFTDEITAALIGAFSTVVAVFLASYCQNRASARQAARARAIDLYLRFQTKEMLEARASALQLFSDHRIASATRQSETVDIAEVCKGDEDSVLLSEVFNFFSGLHHLLNEEEIDADITRKLFGPIVTEFSHQIGYKVISTYPGAQNVISNFEQLVAKLQE